MGSHSLLRNSSHARRFRSLRRFTVCGEAVPIAEGPASRLLGLALLERAKAGPGLLLPGCRSVHTFGMRFPLDLFFLDEGGTPIRVLRGVRPGRVARERRAVAVLERPAVAGDAELRSSERE